MYLRRDTLLSEIDFIDHCFLDRTGGISTGNFRSLNFGFARGDDDQNVLQNRRTVAQHFGIPISNLITLHQKHGDSVHVIDADNIEEYRFKDPESMLNIHGDAIITNIPGLLIGVQTADCAPILLCDKKNRFIAAIHAGWRGALGNIIENTVETLLSLENNRPLSKPLESELLVGKMAHRTAAYLSVREESSTGLTHQEADYEELWKRSNDIVAAIGPCLQRDSFAVNDEIIDRVDDRYLTHLPDKTLFDMQAYITDKLLRLGVKTVSHVNIDTFTQENFFSYRRQDGHCGVQFSGIILRG